MDTNLHFDIKNLTEKQVEHLAKNAVEYAVINGVLMQSKTSPGKTKHAPFILFPTPFPKTLFEQARLVQLDFNLLVHNVSQDHEFLKESLKGTIIADEFTRRIYDIHEQTRNEGIVQPISVGLLRSDYMLQNDKDILLSSPKECNHHLRIKQVEIQTMAAGGTEVNARVAQIGSYVLGLLDKDIPVGSPQLPSNPVGSKIAEGLALALEFYGSKSAIILMVTDPADSAKCDQLWIEYCLHERNPRIKMLRRSLPELHKDAKLGPNKELIVDGYEVAVVYYRYGFNPSEYPSEDAWTARLLVERSLAIKCPTAAVQLVGTKKIQQVLAQSGVLERFITDEAALRRMRETFTGLYSLDEGPEGDQTEKMALANPEKFVLKPQREGGGQNFFGDDIKTVLNQVKCPHERSQYILMDKIQGPTTKNYIVRPEFDKPLFGDVICELGIFGVYISIGGKVIVNREIGHKIRTKSAEHQDGGVNRGIANYDSPYLF